MVSEAIGDLSKADRSHLAYLAQTHTRILEGGVGASTQILTHLTKGSVVSYDTDPKWIERIRDHVFPKVGVKGKCTFRRYEVGTTRIEGKFDLVFVDLEWSVRFEFAAKAWERLAARGVLVFHDARRTKDISLFMNFWVKNYREIESVEICPEDSNLIVFKKRTERCDYENWHKKEGWTKEQLGIDWLQ